MAASSQLMAKSIGKPAEKKLRGRHWMYFLWSQYRRTAICNPAVLEEWFQVNKGWIGKKDDGDKVNILPKLVNVSKK